MANVAQGGTPIPAEASATEPTDKKLLKQQKKEEQAKKKTDKKEKKPAKKRGMTPLRAALIVTLTFLFLLTTAAALVFFNLADSRAIALEFLQTGDHPYQKQLDELTALQESIRLESAALGEAQDTLNAREAEIAKREREIATRETTLSARAADVEEREEAAEEASTELSRLVEIYSGLNAQTAAKIMAEMNDADEVVRILKEMEPDLVSDILTAMDTEFAARISFRMLGD